MSNGHLRVLHTSDWHIGKFLVDKRRDEEFAFFFDWLAETIRERNVDCLLVAGDVFDTCSPSSRMQRMYYHYLKIFMENGCRHIVVTAGNHDPAILLDAPRTILDGMDIHVLGEPSVENPEFEVVVLRNRQGEAELVVCAVPFLREKYVRKSAPGESMQMKEANLLQGIYEHYAGVAEEARRVCRSLTSPLPVIAMGHLFAGEESRLRTGDSERQLYVGTLGRVGCEIFDGIFDYVALGHLHQAQMVDEAGRVWYSGSPMPLAFDEAGRQKSVCLVEFDGKVPRVEIVPVPPCRHLERIEGDWEEIEKKLNALAGKDLRPTPWVEIVYNGVNYAGNLRERLTEFAEGKPFEILATKDLRVRNALLGQMDFEETLEELGPEEVFERCLVKKNVPEEHWPDLMGAFREVCAMLQEENDE